jgi:hypothetical protein
MNIGPEPINTKSVYANSNIQYVGNESLNHRLKISMRDSLNEISVCCRLVPSVLEDSDYWVTETLIFLSSANNPMNDDMK